MIHPWRCIRLATWMTLLLVAAGLSRAGEAWQVASGDSRVSLLELYTSEGCSSCPPADRWVSALARDPELWTRVVPVAFHVTYWDGLGWRDRFARHDFDRRQRRLAAGGGSIVYTPGMFLDGREWRAWRRTHRFRGDDRRPAGNLRLALRDGAAQVSFLPVDAPDRLTVRVAWLLGPQETAVPRGENRGRRLHHDFVVHRLIAADMTPRGGRWEARIPVDDRVVEACRALAVWVEDAEGRPIQAAGGWL